jgi:hypothetical protein
MQARTHPRIQSCLIVLSLAAPAMDVRHIDGTSSLHPSEEGILEEAGAHADDGDGLLSSARNITTTAS